MTWNHVKGEGLWKEYENEETGEKSLKTHEVKPVKQWCHIKEHDFYIVDMSKRLAECKKCGQEINFIVGHHKIDGDRVFLK